MVGAVVKKIPKKLFDIAEMMYVDQLDIHEVSIEYDAKTYQGERGVWVQAWVLIPMKRLPEPVKHKANGRKRPKGAK